MDDLRQSHIEHILNDMVEKYRWHPAKHMAKIQTRWSAAVGPVVARNTRVVYWDHGVVTVAVPTSVWAQEIQYLKPHLLKCLVEQGFEFAVTDLRVRVWLKPFQMSPMRVRGDGERGHRGPYQLSFHPQKNLMELLERVRTRHETAIADWLENGYQRCQMCHSPTLRLYPYCSVCEGKIRQRRNERR